MYQKFLMACIRGEKQTVQEMIKDPKLDPTAGDNWAIMKAADSDQFEIVEILLKETNSNPSAHNNRPLSAACRHCNIAGINMLLSDNRIDPSAHENIAIIEAIVSGCKPAITTLMKDQRVTNNLRKDIKHSVKSSGKFITNYPEHDDIIQDHIDRIVSLRKFANKNFS